MELHDAIIHSGKDMRKPMNLAKQMKALSVGDDDVSAALMMLLSPGEVSQGGGYDHACHSHAWLGVRS